MVTKNKYSKQIMESIKEIRLSHKQNERLCSHQMNQMKDFVPTKLTK